MHTSAAAAAQQHALCRQQPQSHARATAPLPPPPPSFFGKFLGTHADYYVFETTLQAPPEEPGGEALGAARAPPACVNAPRAARVTRPLPRAR